MIVRFILPAWLLFAASVSAWEWQLPAGFPRPLVPAGNPMTTAKVELGRRLFSDPRLSVTGAYSCASCHDPARAFTDGRARALGATGERHARNTPTLVNAAYAASLGWLEDAPRTLEAQHLVPLLNRMPVELGFETTEVFAGDGEIQRQYPNGFATSDLVDALACYVRTLIFGDSAFDRFVYYGEALPGAMARAGFQLFVSPRTGCSDCHRGFNLSGPLIHELSPDTAPDFHGGVRVPTLRNVAVTAPYMHDGSIASLPEVVEFYVAGGRGTPLSLDARERAALVAFLESLTDRRWQPRP